MTPPTAVRVVGIDAAVAPTATGLALAEWQPSGTVLHGVALGRSHDQLARDAADWIAGATRALVAVDAPLGWPAPLADTLGGHQSGSPLRVPPDRLFRRATDRDVRDRLGKQPLDVGADRIARTAVAALDLLERIRRGAGAALALAPSPAFAGDAVIEVYPAGTLRAHGLPDGRYKERRRPEHRAQRAVLLEALAERMALPAERGLLLDAPDVLDAAVCVLAAADFLEGRCPGPTDPALAAREGWIWVREP